MYADASGNGLIMERRDAQQHANTHILGRIAVIRL